MQNLRRPKPGMQQKTRQLKELESLGTADTANVATAEISSDTHILLRLVGACSASLRHLPVLFPSPVSSPSRHACWVPIQTSSLVQVTGLPTILSVPRGTMNMLEHSACWVAMSVRDRVAEKLKVGLEYLGFYPSVHLSSCVYSGQLLNSAISPK